VLEDISQALLGAAQDGQVAFGRLGSLPAVFAEQRGEIVHVLQRRVDDVDGGPRVRVEVHSTTVVAIRPGGDRRSRQPDK
jgi:hypothetical protein